MKEKDILLKVSLNAERIKEEIRKLEEEMKRENPYYQLRLAMNALTNAIIADTKKSPILKFFRRYSRNKK